MRYSHPANWTPPLSSAVLRAVAACLLAFASASPSAAQYVQHFDGDFYPGDWEVAFDYSTQEPGTYHTEGTLLVGGNPTAYRQMQHVTGAPAHLGERTNAEVLHRCTAWEYDPRTEGPIRHVEIGFDARVLDCWPGPEAAGDEVLFQFVLYQGGREYYADGYPLARSFYENAWRSLLRGPIQDVNFRSRDGVDFPDFTPTGAPISFGFKAHTSNYAFADRYMTYKTFGVDNFSVTVFQEPDSDGDGVYDDWERNGIRVKVGNDFWRYTLPEAKVDHANLWLELDVVSGAPIQWIMLEQVVDAFARAPYRHNPDGQRGITLTILVSDVDLPEVGGWALENDWPVNWDAWKNLYYASEQERAALPAAVLQARRWAVRYGIIANQSIEGGVLGEGPLGLAFMPGDDLVLFVGNLTERYPYEPNKELIYQTNQQAIILMHELGHSLGLDHGGPWEFVGADVNYKPNYPSVMNYAWDPAYFDGKTLNLDYSRAGYHDSAEYDESPARPLREGLQDLDETCLDEVQGVGSPTGYYRWASMPFWFKGVSEDPVSGAQILDRTRGILSLAGKSVDLGGGLDETLDGQFTQCTRQNLNWSNRLLPGTSAEGENHYQILRAYNDWENLLLPPRASWESAANAGRMIPAFEPTDEMAWQRWKEIVLKSWNLVPNLKYRTSPFQSLVPFYGYQTKMHQVVHADQLRKWIRPGAKGLRIAGVSFNIEGVIGPSQYEMRNVRIRLGYTNRRPGSGPPVGLSIPDTLPNASGPMHSFFAADQFVWSRPGIQEGWPSADFATEVDWQDWSEDNFGLQFEGIPFDYDPNLGNLLVEVESSTNMVLNGTQLSFPPTSIYSGGPATQWTSRSFKTNNAQFPSAATPGVASKMRFLLLEIAAKTRAVAGVDFSVDEGQAVVLDGTGSEADGEVSYSWSQLPGGTTVSLTGADTATPSFVAPPVAPGGETLAFELTVTADGVTDTDTISITVVNVNHTPIADAGLDQAVVSGARVQLDGSESFDIDNDPIVYSWTQVAGTPLVELSGADGTTPSFIAPEVASAGSSVSLIFELRVDDGFPPDAPAPGYTFAHVVDRVTVEVTSTNHPPVASIDETQTIDENTVVYLDASASSDPDGDALTYAWFQLAGTAVTLAGETTASPSFIAPFVSAGGEDLAFRLTIQDAAGATAVATTVIHVLNANDPPLATAARPSLDVLWPPNHRLVAVTIEGVTDPQSNATIMITAVTQDEPTVGLGDGDTPFDAIINPDGSVMLRAERSGTGDGRVYHVHFTASDPEGSSSGVVTVRVPHQKKTDPVVDGGELHDSTR